MPAMSPGVNFALFVYLHTYMFINQIWLDYQA